MKHSILTCWIILFLLATVSTGALEVHGEFQIGRDVKRPLAFAYVRLEFTQVPATIYGGWRTWFEPDFPWGDPFRDIYDAGLRLDWRGFFVDLNHFCNHPVLSVYDDWLSNVWGEKKTTVSVGMRW